MEKDVWWTEHGAETQSPVLLGQVIQSLQSLSLSLHLGVLVAKGTPTNGKVEGFRMLVQPSHG